MGESCMRDCCGLFGAIGVSDAANLSYLGLYSLQHRGQESAGIVSSDKGKFHMHRGMGLVNTVFGQNDVLSGLTGTAAIGHTRYSTTGASSLTNIQPFVITNRDRKLAIAHNGNLTNSLTLHNALDAQGSIFQTTSDTEIILHLVAKSRKPTIMDAICDALKKVKGAYSLLFLTEDSIIAVRDSRGIRPLCLGKYKRGYVVASETCAFDLVGARYIRDIEPGEVLKITQKGTESIRLFKNRKSASCIFEYVYFARPDSKVFGENVDKIRRRLGKQLAIEHPADADIVIGIPDSANTATLGYSEESGIKYEIGLIRNHYVGRTFIDPDQNIRDLDVRVKFNPVSGVLSGKRVVVVDDSIVRGTTAKKLVQIIRDAGAKEIHFRSSSPPIISPCYYGIDMPTKEELVASSRSVEEIRDFLGVDSLGYLSVEGMLGLDCLPKMGYCASCFTGKYPVAVEKRNGKFRLG
ncbi:MAG: amidophosphoribosyltransferase [candidate division Zixibacteria bacterium]|nr:amidophosphoribosyltransferase [candidate division Zixibacteria bacterium]